MSADNPVYNCRELKSVLNNLVRMEPSYLRAVDLHGRDNEDRKLQFLEMERHLETIFRLRCKTTETPKGTKEFIGSAMK